MSEEGAPLVAVFRPADERMETAKRVLRELGASPLADPMLEVVPTGRAPRADAEVVIITSKTGAERAAAEGWQPGKTLLVAIGPSTAAALRAQGYRVDIVPEEYSSEGLVNRLAPEAADVDIDVARSDHGSDTLLDGLTAAGARVTETVLYELRRPAGAGDSTTAAAEGRLAGALFTSSLTVEHFLAAAAERGHRRAALEGLEAAVVGAIGTPTATTAGEAGIDVDVIPETADFEQLARAVVQQID